MKHYLLVHLAGIGGQGKCSGRDGYAVGLPLVESCGTEGDEERMVVSGHLLEAYRITYKVVLTILEDGA